jgi:hypothetical protein
VRVGKGGGSELTLEWGWCCWRAVLIRQNLGLEKFRLVQVQQAFVLFVPVARWLFGWLPEVSRRPRSSPHNRRETLSVRSP